MIASGLARNVHMGRVRAHLRAHTYDSLYHAPVGVRAVVRIETQGVRISRRSHRETDYTPPVYIGDKVQVPIGGEIKRVTVTDNISFGPVPGAVRFLTPYHIYPSDNFLWDDVKKERRGNGKFNLESGTSPHYYFHGTCNRDEYFYADAVSDCDKHLIHTLTDELWPTALIVLGALVIVFWMITGHH